MPCPIPRFTGARRRFTLCAMKKFFRNFSARIAFPVPALAAILSAFACVPAIAAPEGATATYSRLVDSAYVSGPKIDAESLKGKVVLWEYWGLRCPPCLAAMPHLQELYRKYGARGRFVVIGSHVQMPSPEVADYARKNGITFPIYQHASIPEAPCPGGIPYSVLVGADGKILAAGTPTAIYAEVETAMKKLTAPGRPILPDFKADRYKALADSLVIGGKNLEGKIAALAGKKDDEAKALAKAFSRWKKGELETLKRLLDEDPLAAAEFFDELKDSLPESTKEYAANVAEIRKDKAFAAVSELRKKAEKLEQKKTMGKKISGNEVSALKKKLVPLAADSRESVKAAAKELDSRLDALSGK